MRSIKVAGLTAISHFSKLLVALLIVKLIAMTAGPEGLGFLGNYMSLLSIASALAGGGVLTGVVKYLSEFSIDPMRQRLFVGNALIYSLGFSLVVILFGSVFIKPITNYIFGSLKYTSYIVFFLCAQFFVALNNLAYGVLNGLQQNSRYAVVMVLGNLIAIVVSYVFILYFGTAGAVLAVTVPLLAPLLPMLFFSFNKRNFLQFEPTLLLQDTIRLSRFSIMLIVSAICFPVVEIYIRSTIVATAGLEMSGIWQALIRLSSAYLGFYSVFLSFYLVPKISATEDKRIILKTVCTIMLALSALFACMLTVALVMKEQIIKFVLSESFLAVGNYLALQMLGDYFRIMGWVIGFVVVAKASTKLYICGELFQGVVFMFFASLLLGYFKSLEGVVMGYALTCFLYFILSVAGFLYYIKKLTLTI